MEILGQALSVLLVLGLAVGAVWLLGRRSGVSFWAGHNSHRRPGRLALGPHHVLYLVRVGDRALLLAIDPDGARLLAGVALDAVEKRPGIELL